jgi:hypothetical protein
VIGHTSLKEIERYTARARSKRLATEAIGKLKSAAKRLERLRNGKL